MHRSVAIDYDTLYIMSGGWEYMHSNEDFIDVTLGEIKVAFSSMLMKSAMTFLWQQYGSIV